MNAQTRKRGTVPHTWGVEMLLIAAAITLIGVESTFSDPVVSSVSDSTASLEGSVSGGGRPQADSTESLATEEDRHMPQKWYTKASVQAAVAAGVFAVLAAVIAGLFGLYQGWFTHSSGTLDRPTSTAKERPLPQSPGDNTATVEVPLIRDLSSRRTWHGLIEPVAQIDVWLRYAGPGQLFIDSIKLYHLETNLLSAASGAFPASHRYKLRYDSGAIVERKLYPPLVINPQDQQDIHIELDISPRDSVTVGGCSACIAFARVRTSTGLSAQVPLFAPLATDLVKARVLNETLTIDVARVFEVGYNRSLRVPQELSVGMNLCQLSPSGSIQVRLSPTGIRTDHGETVLGRAKLESRLGQLLAIAQDPGEPETIAAAAISLLSVAEDANVLAFLREVKRNSASHLKRRAASHALAVLEGRQDDDFEIVE